MDLLFLIDARKQNFLQNFFDLVWLIIWQDDRINNITPSSLLSKRSASVCAARHKSLKKLDSGFRDGVAMSFRGDSRGILHSQLVVTKRFLPSVEMTERVKISIMTQSFGRHPGFRVQFIPHCMRGRNDKKWCFMTFYECRIFSGCHKNGWFSPGCAKVSSI